MSPKLILGGVVFLAAVGFIYYVVDLNNDLNDALVDNEKLEKSVETQQSLIESQKRDLRQVQSINSGLNAIISRQKNESRELNERFNTSGSGGGRDLGKISLEKPGLVEGIVNDATAEVNRCFEILTGSPVTPDDLSNDECKEVINADQG